MRTYSIEINTRFKEVYHLDDLENLNERLEYAKSRLLKDIEEINKHQLELFQRYQEVLNTDYFLEVELSKRREYNTNRVIFELSLNKYPTETGRNWNYSKRLHFERYTGQQRREALKDAEALAKQYHLTLNKTGEFRRE